MYCNIDLKELKRLFPIQNGGTSSKNIAEVARELLASTKPVIRVKEKNKYMEDLKLEIKYLLREKFVRAKSTL